HGGGAPSICGKIVEREGNDSAGGAPPAPVAVEATGASSATYVTPSLAASLARSLTLTSSLTTPPRSARTLVPRLLALPRLVPNTSTWTSAAPSASLSLCTSASRAAVCFAP